MILEVARMHITPGKVDEFLAALPEGIEVLQEAAGFLGIEIHRGIERPELVLLCLRWETLENHTVDFREGPLFSRWRAVISPYFAAAPEVEHFTIG